jgi:A/G-specific adenine glycosylase
MTLGPFEVRRFRTALLRWYATCRRDLPWRRTTDPYRIRLSEIMLQQTRVNAVMDKYSEFLRLFPDVRSLAAAHIDDVLAAWSGLGYYRRARSLHRAARVIRRQHSGQVPRTSAELLNLPGIGRYTAAAVASIAFGESCAVVDGNVERVIRRILNCPRTAISTIWAAADELLSRRSPGNFNQAMMELGALVCLPVRPACGRCPLRSMCATRGAHVRTVNEKRKQAEANYGLSLRSERVYLVRRSSTESLMPGMWELPAAELNSAPPVFMLRHSITVTDYTVRVFHIPMPPACGGRWFPLQDAAALPLTGLARRILRRAALI